MRGIGARHIRRPDRLYQLLAIVGELVDGMHVIVDEPHVLLCVVRAHVDRMRTLHDLVPLRPLLDDVALRVDHGDAVLPARVNTNFPVWRLRAPPDIHALFRILARAASAWKCGCRRASPRHPANRKLDARTHFREASHLRSRKIRQLASGNEVNAIRVLREDALPCAPRPLVMPGQGADVLRPPLDHFVRAHMVLGADRLGYRGKLCTHWWRLGLWRRRHQAIAERNAGGEPHGERQYNRYSFVHANLDICDW